jgi:hypothetical protein
MQPLIQAIQSEQPIGDYLGLINIPEAKGVQAYPLHYAVADPDLVVVLLILGADPNARDRWGRTPLHWAAMQGDPTVIQILIAAGATTTACDIHLQTPLELMQVFGRILAA